MKQMTSQQIADKQVSRAAAAVGEYVNGVKAVTVSPTEEAAKNLQKAAMNYQDAVSSGRMEKRLRAVSKDDWIKATVEKGQSRYASGVAASKGKVVAFYDKFLPVLQRTSAEVNAMPSTTFEDSMNRMLHNARKLHEFKLQ